MITPGEIDKVFLGLDTKLRKFKTEVGVEFQRTVEEKTPVGKTGHLKASWYFERKAKDIEVGNFAEYASYVEFGTPHMAPRGMMRATILEMDRIVEVAKDKAGLKK